jgi:hypothetical protein
MAAPPLRNDELGAGGATYDCPQLSHPRNLLCAIEQGHQRGRSLMF